MKPSVRKHSVCTEGGNGKLGRTFKPPHRPFLARAVISFLTVRVTISLFGKSGLLHKVLCLSAERTMVQAKVQPILKGSQFAFETCKHCPLRYSAL